jgi:uncharacterized repeat protein (TIGR02543 family)
MKKLFSFISVVVLAAILGVSSASAKSVAKVTEVTNGAVLVDVAKDGIRLSPSGDTLYVAHRGADDVAVKAYNAATLELIADLPGFAFGNNYGGDVAVDDRNYVYGTRAIIAATAEVVVARWTSITDTPDTLVALLGSTYGIDGTYRAGYGFDVNIDKSGNGFIILPVPNNAAGAAGASFVYIPVANDVAGTPQQVALAKDYGKYPRVRIINDTEFWYDGASSAPVLVTMAVAEDGTVSVAKELVFPTMAEPVVNGQGNGVSDFVLGDKRYMVIGTNNHNSGAQFLKPNLEMLASVNVDETISAEWIAGLPIEGMGSATNSIGCTTSDVCVKDGLATIYVSAMANGLRKFTCEIVETVNVTLNVNDATMGTVTGGGELGKNTEATIIATPNLGHSFVAWMNGTDTVATTAEYTFEVKEDVTLTAVFQKEADVKLTLAVNDAAAGSITLPEGIVMGENTVAYGTVVTLTAVPVEGATLNGWYNGEALYSTDYTINVPMTADMALTAKFVKVLTLAYELNGGVTNDYGWTSKGALMLEIQNDYNTAYNGSLSVVKEENGQYWFYIVDKWMTEYEAQGQPATVGGFFQAKTWSADQKCGRLFLETQKDKYAFLVELMDAFASTSLDPAGRGTIASMAASSQDAYFRADVSGFMLNSPATAAYPYTCNWTQAGLPESYTKIWKHAFANPTEIKGEVVLNTPYKEGYTFDGWYATADFSGDPIVTVSPESVIEGGKLYAKWIEYMPTIKEVREMEVGQEVKVKVIVNHVGGNTVYVEDASGLGMDIYMKNSGLQAAQEAVVIGTITNAKGWPRLEGKEVVSTKDGKLFDPVAINFLSELINDSTYKYYARRIAISGLTVAKYDSNGDVYFTDGTDTVQGYYMKLDQTTFPVGKVVNINGAVAAWYGENFQFTGDVASVALAPKGLVDTYAYPTRHEKYSLKNEWVYSVQDGNYKGNEPGAYDMVRGMVARDGKMYFADRGTASIIVVDGATGEKLDPIPVKGDHLFERQGEDGAWSLGCMYAYNDIKMDNAGNCLIGACLVSSQQNFYIYTVDLETGEATELINECLLDNPDFAAAGIDFRFDAFGVSGDVKGNACIMAADSKDGWRVYRWLITEGVAGKAEMITVKPTVDNSLFASSAGFGTAPQVFPQDENGDYFYVDGSSILPMLCDGSGTVIEDFKFCPTDRQVWNNEGDTINMTNTQPNGVCEFEVNGEYFMVMVAEYQTGAVSTKFALFKFDNDYRTFMEMEPLWYFPNKGMGSDQYQGRSAVPYVDVVGNTAHIYLYATNNGYAAYTFTVGETSAVEDVEVIKVGAKKVIENGQVFIIKNGIKYNALGAEVK